MPLHRRHRPFQVLAGVATLIGLLPVAFHLSLSDPRALAGAFSSWAVGVYLAAAAGTLLAATTFAPGEALRPAWLLLAASYAVLLPARLLAGVRPAGLFEGTDRLPAVVSLCSLASGVLGVAGFLLLARAWRAAGLDVTTRASRVILRLGALAVALVLAGADLLERFPAAAAGDPMAIADVITDLLDGALFVVAVPVLRAALALGGGLVAWPWLLLTSSLLAWLGFDAAVTFGGALGVSPRSARVVEEAMRSLGAAFAFAAGIAQRWIMQQPPGGDEATGPPGS